MAETTIVEQAQIPTNASPIRDLQPPEEVQALVEDPRGGKLGPNGLPEDRGRRLLFGDPAVVASLRRTG